MKFVGAFALTVPAAASSCPFVPSWEGHQNAEGACAACNISPWYATDGKCSCGTSDADWITIAQWRPCQLLTEELKAAAEPCPFTEKTLNSEGECATCDKSPWYDSDQKCTCGPSQADWITADQVVPCTSEELKVAAEPCPFTEKTLNSEGDCATCFISPWYDSDQKCTCGPSQADWITVDQVVPCPSEELKAAAEPCPFTQTHFNVEGDCATCFISPWYDSDQKCSCGPSQADWITVDQVVPCPSEDLKAAAEPCPFTEKHYNAEGDCATCFKSPWYDSDQKCTCGPSQADWITADQVVPCPSEELKATAEPCPFIEKHYNAEGDCATCFISPWYDSDQKCTCGPSQADWITVDQVVPCPSEELEAAAEPCPFTEKHYNVEGDCATCFKSPWYDSDQKCTCGPSQADWITVDQVVPCPSEELKAAAEPCPFTQANYNAEGDCATCFKSPWYDADHKCTCGPSQADWITVDQVVPCPSIEMSV